MNPFFQAKHLVAAAAALVAMSGAQALTLDTNDYTCVGNCGTLGANGDITASPLGGNYAFVSTAGSTAASGLYPAGDTAVLPGDLENGSVALSSVFQWTGGNFTSHYKFVTTDGKEFSDIAWARLVNPTNANELTNTVAWLFTARGSNKGANNIVPGNLDRTLSGTRTALSYTELDSKDGNFVDWSPLGASSHTCWTDSNSGCGYTNWITSTLNLAAGNYRLEVGVVNYQDNLFDSGLAFDLATLPAAPVPEPGTLPMMLAALGTFGAFARRRMNRGA